MANPRTNPREWEEILKAVNAGDLEKASELVKKYDFDIEQDNKNYKYYYELDGKVYRSLGAMARDLGVDEKAFSRWYGGSKWEQKIVEKVLQGRHVEEIKIPRTSRPAKRARRAYEITIKEDGRSTFFTSVEKAAGHLKVSPNTFRRLFVEKNYSRVRKETLGKLKGKTIIINGEKV